MNSLRKVFNMAGAVWLVICLLQWTLPAKVYAQPNTQTITFKKGLSIPSQGHYARSMVYTDDLEYRLVTDQLREPESGRGIDGAADAKKKWSTIETDSSGWFKSRDLFGGYLYLTVQSDRSKMMILEASGFNMVFVNGVRRGGEVYGYDWIRHPVQLKKGKNEFLFRGARGRMKASLVEPKSAVQFTKTDPTMPDLVVGEDASTVWGAIRVINAQDRTLDHLKIRSQVKGAEPVESDVPVITKLTTRKIGFKVAVPKMNEKGNGKVDLSLQLLDRRGKTLDQTTVPLDVRAPMDDRSRTFVSQIDGSVQYYSVSPGDVPDTVRAALFLSVHGASVPAINQARAYSPKAWGDVVAPTNRRPYGFDWEDWGRLDAMEVLKIAKKRLNTDPMHTYLTGHSMGGHGTWQLGAIFPDKFAAIGACSGWISFSSYTHGNAPERQPDPIEKLVDRSRNSSNTLKMKRNYLHYGIYILHGSDDHNVPVEQARTMRGKLGQFHPDFEYYEYPGGGHWFGNQSVDWQPLFNFFKWHSLRKQDEIKKEEFYTASPGINASSNWVTIDQQVHPLQYSSVNITQDVEKRTFEGITDNVKTLALNLTQLNTGDSVIVRLDSQEVKIPTTAGQDKVWLKSTTTPDQINWKVTEKPGVDEKNPKRYGLFKDAFRHHMVFVYATHGNREENAWSYNKARYDAETFWYRGNGSIDIISDREFSPEEYKDRSVIIFGNRDINSAWKDLLNDSPVQVTRKQIKVGEHIVRGDDLGTYFIRPRQDSDIASVGVIAGTGMKGNEAISENRYFVSGSGFPDLTIIDFNMLRDGWEGVKAAGFFGNDWSVEKGELMFRE